jgi:hypothetical protein
MYKKQQAKFSIKSIIFALEFKINELLSNRCRELLPAPSELSIASPNKTGEIMKLIFLSLVTLMSASAFGESQLLDAAALRGCGGKVELREAANGDLALKFMDNGYSKFSEAKCPNLRFVDASSNRTIKEYDVRGSSYTLSNKMRDSLSSDCTLKVQFDNGAYTTQYITVKLTRCSAQQPSYPKNPYSYELSGRGNCKLMVNSAYANKNVEDVYCQPARGDKNTSVRYEYSRSGNCKIMLNDRFSEALADGYFCSKQH